VDQLSWKIGVAEPCGEFGNAFGAVIHRVPRLVAEREELPSNGLLICIARSPHGKGTAVKPIR
jgi:hypothetical protein